MIAKMVGASMGSPTLAAAQLRQYRLPAQMRRGLPLYIACVCFVLFIFNMSVFQTGTHHRVASLSPFSSSAPPQTSNPRARFPRKMWQTWKVHPYAFEQRDYEVAKTWTEHNPDWRYEVLTDGNDMDYVEWHFGPGGFNRPDIVEFYRNVKAAIIKADLLRYIIMYAEGGVYADIDVEALKPMSKFIPERFNQEDIDLVVGVEIDEPDWRDHPILGPKSRSFCQWTFMTKPQMPAMLQLIEQIMTWLNGIAKKQKVSISEVELDFDQVISGTGPSAFTNVIMAYMNQHSSRPITWNDFHDLDESKIVSRVLVLTVEAFAAGQGHSNSGNHEARAALVRHHYHASNWPSRHPRYSHPVYGEVEQCNWNDECVHQWDEDVANFEKLSEKEKKKKIAEKQEKDRQEEQARKDEEEKKRKEEEENRRKEEEEERRKAAEDEAEAKRKKAEEQARATKQDDSTKKKAP